jgi:dimethylamine monooxygenase subunit A
MTAVLQSHLPFAPWIDPVARKLPGMRPVDLADWIVVDDAFAAQMRLRDSLTAAQPDVVLRLDNGARPAAEELLTMLVDTLGQLPGFDVQADGLRRPDGITVRLERSDPMATIARLCQDDFCILEKQDAEHVLTAAALCFPASWSLAQKFLRPLIGIHTPVPSYDSGIAARVQRLFDAIRPGQVLCRANVFLYHDADLHQPRREGESRPRPGGAADFVRSERQCLRRLPTSGAVVFSIHTYVVRRKNLTGAQETALRAYMSDGDRAF